MTALMALGAELEPDGPEILWTEDGERIERPLAEAQATSSELAAYLRARGASVAPA